MKSWRAYIINLDRAAERWEHMSKTFMEAGISNVRVSAVDGNELILPHPDFHEKKFRRFHGRKVNIFEVACYLSHLKAMKAFLESNDDFGMICEDDLFLKAECKEVVEAALANSSCWNILRLTGLSEGQPLQVKQLFQGYSLTLHIGRLKGAGAYLIDRKAASILVRELLPLWLPWDHAIDREWNFGLKALAVAPFPISQADEKFESAIQKNSQPKLSTLQRYLTTYPYQAVNEIARWIARGFYFLKLKLVCRLFCSTEKPERK
ncbi:MAG: glycosyltransferase family 25 protein [Verrucomicrobia bacterium]|nr:glycosyltransferase family 25 protein [Verrucomicrobiota bacterium]